MAKKNILISNNGKYQPMSASIDVDTGELSSSYAITLNTSSFATSGLMQIKNGQIIPVLNTSSIQNNPEDGTYSGSVLTFNSIEGAGPHRVASSFSGDISGDLVGGIKVRSVSNVTNGILPLGFGGTGRSTFTSGSLVTTSGSGPVYSALNNNNVVASTGSNGEYGFVPSAAVINQMTGTIVYLYTGSVGTNRTFTWTKPSGCRFVRVICQGAGGGGAAGIRNASAAYSNGAGGGGGGGLSDVTFNALNISNTVICSIGAAGTGGAAGDTVSPSNPGIDGGSSSFGNYIYAGGGFGGSGATSYASIASQAGAAGGAGGVGYTEFGGSGGAGGILNTNYAYGGNYGNAAISRNRAGAGGGGGGAGVGNKPGGLLCATRGGDGGAITFYGITGGIGSLLNANSTSGSTKNIFSNLSNVFVNNILTSNFPNILRGGGGAGGGGSGTSISNPGSAGLFGSGGGAGGSAANGVAGNNEAGGSGGVGYIVIICY